MGRKKFKKSIEQFDKAIELEPSFEDAIFNLDFANKKINKR